MNLQESYSTVADNEILLYSFNNRQQILLYIKAELFYKNQAGTFSWSAGLKQLQFDSERKSPVSEAK